MWWFKKKIGQRRLEVRRSIPPTTAALWQRFRDAGGLTAALMGAVLFAAILAMDVWPLDPLEYHAGQYIPIDVHSRVDFSVLAQDKLNDRMKEAAEKARVHFNLNKALVSRVTGELQKFPQRLKATTQPSAVKEDIRGVLGLEGADAAAVLGAWQSYAEETRQKELYDQIDSLGEALAECHSVSGGDYADLPSGKESAELAGPSFTIPIDFTIPVDIDKLLTLNSTDAADRIRAKARTFSEPFDTFIRPGVRAYLTAALLAEPMYVYDKAATIGLAEEAANRVLQSPPKDCYKLYKAGEVIVQAGAGKNGKGLSGADLDLLQLEQSEYLVAGGFKHPWSIVKRVALRGVVLLLAVLFICVYIAVYQPRALNNSLRAVALGGAVLLMLAANKVLIFVVGANPYACVLPVLMAVVVLTIAYDQRFALGLGAVMSALVVLQMRVGLDVFILLGVAVSATVLQLGEIRTRSKLITVLGISGVLAAGVTLCFGLFETVPIRFVLIDSLWAGLSALLVGFLAQGLMPLIERVFGAVTSMTLLEWCDASKPLMRRIAMEAPGTHNHSLQLGSICEAAADVIGARGLLARVGAYYHDIGKIHKSEYFSENQGASASKHAKLSPAMSLLIIIGHVKDGVELAREYALPRVLHEFIATHHGTTLVQYFYHVAAEQRKDAADRAPDEVEFRYPGPKPQSSEAAILMLADASESSVRAMSEPTSGRIENQVHTMVNRRLMDGQLDECDLTLRQVHQIETSIIKSLCGIYHSRISYPAPPGEKPSASEIPNEEKADDTEENEPYPPRAAKDDEDSSQIEAAPRPADN